MPDTVKLTKAQRNLLESLADGEAAVLWGRGGQAAMARKLVDRGLLTQRLQKRGFMAYRITDAGRQALDA